MRVSVVQAVKYISAFYTSFRKWAFQKVMQFKVEFWKKKHLLWITTGTWVSKWVAGHFLLLYLKEAIEVLFKADLILWDTT